VFWLGAIFAYIKPNEIQPSAKQQQQAASNLNLLSEQPLPAHYLLPSLTPSLAQGPGPASGLGQLLLVRLAIVGRLTSDETGDRTTVTSTSDLAPPDH
jgi:hypothetical protein